MSSEKMQVGPYTILRKIGMGGMGETYLVSKSGLGGIEQRFCLKRIGSHYAMREESMRRFVREAQLAASLSHSSIVTQTDSGIDAQGIPFIVFEYVEGCDLKALLDWQPQRRLRWALVVHIGIAISRALEHAHNRGVGERVLLHLDISPGNILLSMHAEAKLADFGVSREVTSGRYTEVDVMVGKHHYMSPEVIGKQQVGPPSDIYSLGAVLHEALTGQPPYPGSDPMQVATAMVLRDRPPLRSIAPPDVPDALIGVIEKMIADEMADRYQSGHDVLEALRPFVPSRHDEAELAHLVRTIHAEEDLGNSVVPGDDGIPDSPQGLSPYGAAPPRAPVHGASGVAPAQADTPMADERRAQAEPAGRGASEKWPYIVAVVAISIALVTSGALLAVLFGRTDPVASSTANNAVSPTPALNPAPTASPSLPSLPAPREQARLEEPIEPEAPDDPIIDPSEDDAETSSGTLEITLVGATWMPSLRIDGEQHRRYRDAISLAAGEHRIQFQGCRELHASLRSGAAGRLRYDLSRCRAQCDQGLECH